MRFRQGKPRFMSVRPDWPGASYTTDADTLCHVFDRADNAASMRRVSSFRHASRSRPYRIRAGDTLVERLTSAGHVLAERALLRDDVAMVREQLKR